MRVVLSAFWVLTLLSVCLCVQTGTSFAETLYNGSRGSSASGSPLYNSTHGYRAPGAPIFLNQMLEGKSDGTTNRVSGRSGSHVYGSNSASKSTTLSPEAVRASRASLDARAKELAKERAKEREAHLEQMAGADSVEDTTNQYLSRFQSDSTGSLVTPSQERVLYKQNRLNINTPQRVFNSVY